MGPGYFIIAILGCSDGATACTPVMTVPTRYESESACTAAVSDALVANSNFDFPSLLAQCQPVTSPAAAETSSDPAPAKTSKV